MSTVLFAFAIDRGGTFTDVIAHITTCTRTSSHQRTVELKLLSQDPHYKNAPSEGIRRVLAKELGRGDLLLDRTIPIPTDNITLVRMGTTIATNALLERRGARCAVFVTGGMEDVLRIGTQARPDIFALDIRKPSVLCEEVIGIHERVQLLSSGSEEGCTTRVIRALDEEEVERKLREVYAKGIRSIGVAFVHSFAFPDHEDRFGAIARRVGFEHVALSSQLMRMRKFLHRASTAMVDAYVGPLVKQYVADFKSEFALPSNPTMFQVQFMQSDGGLADADRFQGFRSIISGPAGGVVGCQLAQRQLSAKMRKSAKEAVNETTSAPSTTAHYGIIGFDMGGTSTDVCRGQQQRADHTTNGGDPDTEEGSFPIVHETTINGISILAPQLDVETVASGGGSLLAFTNGIFTVGPQSAGAIPGPVCYGRGGRQLTITDANLLLGRIQPEFFPKCFGSSGTAPVDRAAVVTAFTLLVEQIKTATNGVTCLTLEEAAQSFIEVANETMCRSIRNITEAKGHRTSDHELVCFGGAGGQHACAIGRALGIETVHIHRYSGLLSAVGIAAAPLVCEKAAAVHAKLCSTIMEALVIPKWRELSQMCREELEVERRSSIESVEGEGTQHRPIVVIERSVRLRYDGTINPVLLSLSSPQHETHTQEDPAAIAAHLSTQLDHRNQREFGFSLEGKRSVIVDDVIVRISLRNRTTTTQVEEDEDSAAQAEHPPQAAAVKFIEELQTVETTFNGTQHSTKIIKVNQNLTAQAEAQLPEIIYGPALVLQNGSTIFVDPFASANIFPTGDVVLNCYGNKKAQEDSSALLLPSKFTTQYDPLPLSIFSHRFMSIAERMGHALQRTAISTNIKERLDFSCALFDGDGNLLANAPHIPVHLGAMGVTVRYQKSFWGEKWRPGDVMVCNHPSCGGSHLPDITVISAYFAKASDATNSGEPLFYVASRGHHSDIGGISPGSMPPFSRTLDEEGAVIRAYKIVANGTFDEEGVRELLKTSRRLEDCVSDLKAQVAANQKGLQLVEQLFAYFGQDVVLAYMQHIQSVAGTAVRALLKDAAGKLGERFTHTDYMDRGSKISLTVSLSAQEGTAVFDFTKSGPPVEGNINCPAAVLRSAVLYSLRCLLKSDIPLNEGCLRPVEIRVRTPSLLSPPAHCAVVAGNVLTSQRLCDVVLMAFKASACAQGDMNNVIFGDATTSYYETVCGGSGAGPGFHGADAVQVHMTNTRITDVEVFESRYAALLRLFRVRKDSGGEGRFRGGNGCVRSMIFLKPYELCVLSERRALAPQGLSGGEDAKRGVNLLTRRHQIGDEISASEGEDSSYLRDLFCAEAMNAELVEAADEQEDDDKLSAALNNQQEGATSGSSFKPRPLRIDVGGSVRLDVLPGDVFTLFSPGGGGFEAAVNN